MTTQYRVTSRPCECGHDAAEHAAVGCCALRPDPYGGADIVCQCSGFKALARINLSAADAKRLSDMLGRFQVLLGMVSGERSEIDFLADVRTALDRSVQ